MHMNSDHLLSHPPRLLLGQQRARANNVPTRRTDPAARLPEALPTLNYYEEFPHRVGAVGNVLGISKEELEAWLLIARLVTREEAEKRGGCIVYTPPSATGRKQKSNDTLYYCITDSDDEVYGRAAYLRLSALAAIEAAMVEEEEVFTNVFEGCDGDAEESAFANRTTKKPSLLGKVGDGDAARETARKTCGEG